MRVSGRTPGWRGGSGRRACERGVAVPFRLGTAGRGAPIGVAVTDQDRLLLGDIRALELGHIVAGPSGGLLLADLGADVIKVEEPRAGDQSRGMPNRGSTFYAL